VSTEHATEPTQPYAAPDRGSVLPPPPSRPTTPAPSIPAPTRTSSEPWRTITDRGVRWPTAPPESGRGVADPLSSVPSWVPQQTPSSAPGSSLPPGSPPSSPESSGAPRRGPFVAVLAVVALLAGLLGAVIGVQATDDDPTTTPVTTAVDRPAGNSSPTVAPPISGAVDEPAAAVAQAVGPAVVLIQSTIGEGSGIIYDTSGLIVTNAHVVQGFDQVNVTLADGEIYENAEVVGADENRDIAVVRITPRGTLTAAVFGPTDDVHVGEIAIAIGSPFGLEQTVTAGIVSAVGRVVNPTNPVEMIQTDAPINPGNSGGPLADAQGRVIGMNTSIRTADGTNGSVGVGFAIPSDTLTAVAKRIVNGESLDVAYLGVRGSAPTGSSSGVVLIDIRPDSPAEKAGLKDGDEVQAIDGDAVANMSSLSARIQLHQPGDTVTLTIERDGQQLDVPVTLGSTGG
jgi:S1-C subfamily serine protease